MSKSKKTNVNFEDLVSNPQNYVDSFRKNIFTLMDIHDFTLADEESIRRVAKLDKEAEFKTTENIPVINGSSAFLPAYAAFVYEVYPEGTTLGSKYFKCEDQTNGYKSLISGTTDIYIGMQPDDLILELANSANVELQFTPIGMEAIYFYVSGDNPINDLTSENIRDIYSGRIANWNELGVHDGWIEAYQQSSIFSDSRKAFEAYMGALEIIEPELVRKDYYGDIIYVPPAYTNSPDAIGYSLRYYPVTFTSVHDSDDVIKFLSIDGIKPNDEDVVSGKYPVMAPFYAVTVKGNDNPNVQLLLDWIVSDEGQELLEKTGYAGIN